MRILVLVLTVLLGLGAGAMADTPPSPLPAADAKPATISGDFSKRAFKAEGQFTLAINEEGRAMLTLSDDFRTRGGPDLKIFHSPLDAATVTGNNATQGALFVSPLQSHRGGQEYILPEGARLEDYKTVLIHCEEYAKLWAVGTL